MSVILDGKKLREKLLTELKLKVDSFDKKPTLVVILVGEDPASKIYVNNKKKTAEKLGINSQIINYPYDVTEKELLEKIEELNNDSNITAILVQLPLPKHISKENIINAISPKKDVDGFTPYNFGKLFSGEEPIVYPCTPKGILLLLKEYNIDIEGKHVVILGRSNIVGKPLIQCCLQKNATVTVCHSKTKNLEKHTREADVVIAAIGQAKFVKADMVKEGAVIIDVGINRNEDGKLVGDVDFEAVSQKASYITPVPGGVGPMTIAMLMNNVIKAAKKQNLN